MRMEEEEEEVNNSPSRVYISWYVSAPTLSRGLLRPQIGTHQQLMQADKSWSQVADFRPSSPPPLSDHWTKIAYTCALSECVRLCD